jgi:hypothetical protein
MQREVFIDAAKPGDEIILERADGAFGGVATMQSRGHELIVDLLVGEKCFEGCGTFVVEALEVRLEAGGA